MIGGQVEHHLDILYGSASYTGFAQIGLDELDLFVGQMSLNVLQFAAGQVIYDSHSGVLFHQGIHQVRANEGCSARDQDTMIFPHVFSSVM
jgi:hypothetical protein